ncbi:hypothetical protein PRNP1_006044 [Phytophthora ramorum]
MVGGTEKQPQRKLTEQGQRLCRQAFLSNRYARRIRRAASKTKNRGAEEKRQKKETRKEGGKRTTVAMSIRGPMEPAAGSERGAEAEAKEREAPASEAKETDMTEEGSVHVKQEAEEKVVEVVEDSPPVVNLAEEKEAETVVDRPPVTDATETDSSIGNQRKRRRVIVEDVRASGESSSDEDVAAPELLPMQLQS